MRNNLENKLNETNSGNLSESSKHGNKDVNSIISYIKDCLKSENSDLYGNFQERTAFNITQFPKIHGSMLIRMGIVYPIMSYLMEKAGISKDSHSELFGMTINYHTWAAGYFAYLSEIQLGLSKYPIEFVQRLIKKVNS